MPYWYTKTEIPISYELIAKLHGEHWLNHPPKEIEPRIKPRLDALAERIRTRQGWPPFVRPTDDELRVHYGVRKKEDA